MNESTEKLESRKLPAKLPMKEYAARRQQLLRQMAPNSIAILPSASPKIRNRDAEYPFRQDSDFYYLTGFPEPEAVLALIPGREHGEVVLFCKERNPEFELWNGRLAGQEGAVANYGVDDAFPIADIDEILPGLIEGRSKVYYAMGRDEKFDRQVMDWINAIRAKVRSGAQPPGEFAALEHLLHDMRLYKSPAEVKVMAEAGEITAQAHIRAMKACRPGMFEYQLEAEINYCFLMNGARASAYNAIVGGGDNACILHYTENDQVLRDGDLVLIDAGCELDHYAADITRTFPVSGKFSPEQRTLYELVLSAQTAAIAATKPGNHWNQPHEAAVRVLSEGLLELGIIQAPSLEEAIAQELYRPFYMHRTGHWLGMDVHDVGDYKVGGEWRVLEPGMVTTVEPGLYIAANCETVEPRWRGIGIRIEDDVVVTKDGCRVLTASAPKTVADIERIMAER